MILTSSYFVVVFVFVFCSNEIFKSAPLHICTYLNFEFRIHEYKWHLWFVCIFETKCKNTLQSHNQFYAFGMKKSRTKEKYIQWTYTIGVEWLYVELYLWIATPSHICISSYSLLDYKHFPYHTAYEAEPKKINF